MSTDAPRVNAQDERATYREVFRTAEFPAIFAAFSVSIIGSVVASVALTVLVYQRTGSPALAGAVFSIEFAPYLFGGIVAASIVDRFPARRVLVACDVTCAALVALMLIPGLPLVGILVLLAGVGLVSPIFSGIRSATIAEILPSGPVYVLGGSLMSSVAQVGQIAGNAVGGLLLVAVSPRGALAIDVVSFLGSALVLALGMSNRAPAGAAAASASIGSGLAGALRGLREVLSYAPLRPLLLVGWALPFCVVAPEALAAPFVSHLGLSSSHVGYLLVAMPAGMAISGIAAGRLLSFDGQLAIVRPAFALSVVPALVFVIGPGFVLALALLFLIGLGGAYSVASGQRLLERTPEAMRGRAFAAWSAGLMFFQGIGFTFWGVIAEVASPHLVVAIAGVVATVIALAPLPRPALRALERPGDPAEV